ncbi:MAG: DNA-directed RNA polymerase subunit K [Promethearchaeota archaeon]
MPRGKKKTGTKETSKKDSKEDIRKPAKNKPSLEEEVKTKPIPEKRSRIKHGFIPTPKIWPDHLTKFEKSRIIGARALQISMGAPILVEELEKLGNPVTVAERELEFGILPLTIRRIFPSGEIIDVPLEELLENE